MRYFECNCQSMYQPGGRPMSATGQRGAAFEPQGRGGFDQCWYPLALAAEIAPGQVVGRGFLSGKVVVYRTKEGVPHVMSAYCRHLGADLSLGTVIGNDLRCPFHYWHYDGDGRCSLIPAGDTPPPGARLFKFPTAESMGLIWAFNGESSLYEVPGFGIPEADLELRVWRNPNETPIDHHLFFLNAFDLQHFKAVHGMNIAFDPNDVTVGQHTIGHVFRATTPEFGPIVQYRKLWGTSVLTMWNMRGTRRLFMAHALCALPAGRCQGYVVNATPKDVIGEEGAAAAVLKDAQSYARRLIEEDLPIMQTIRFRQDHLTASDRLLAEGIRWIRSYPRANPAESLLQ
jgi:phenylpropionate dioxygenase-like ring-hydroxylating dioxygenase large terminal subunit